MDMSFGPINLLGGIIIVLILIPNIVYALSGREVKRPACNLAITVIEQIGRYACIILMWMPLLVCKFGFRSVEELLIYVIGNGALLVSYYVLWIVFYVKRWKKSAIALAVISTCIFLLSGLMLRHWLLVTGAVLFGTGHIYITLKGEYSK